MTSRSLFGRPFQEQTARICSACLRAVPAGDALQRRLLDGRVVCAPACPKPTRTTYDSLFPSEED